MYIIGKLLLIMNQKVTISKIHILQYYDFLTIMKYKFTFINKGMDQKRLLFLTLLVLFLKVASTISMVLYLFINKK